IAVKALQDNAEEAANNFTMFHQLFDNILNEVAGDGKANTHRSTRAGSHRCIHGNHFSIEVGQWTTRVAMIDSSIGLDEFFDSCYVKIFSSFGTHMAKGYSGMQAKRVADGNYTFAHFNIV